jgi:GAF domain-containing protein
MKAPASSTAASNPGAGVYENWRERFVRPILVGASIFGLLALIMGLTANRGMVQNVSIGVAYVAVLLATVFRVPYWMRVTAFMMAAYALGLGEFVQTGIMGRASFFFLALTLFATLMVSARAGFIALALTLLTYAVMGFLVGTGSIVLINPDAIPARLIDYISVSTVTILFAIVFILGLRQLLRAFLDTEGLNAKTMAALQAERLTLEDRVEARTRQLQAVNDVGRVASSILDPQDLAGRVANLITESFGYYYAALFLVDESGDQAWLYSATGEAGRVLKENKHHLKVGGNSMVGMAITTAKPRVAVDVGEESVRFQNPLLPYTRSEIALPLVVGERVLGALDVQSTKAGAFGPQELETLQGMATQVAIALDNARLFESAQKSLDEMESVQRQYLSEAWRPYAGNEDFEYRVGEEDSGTDNHLQIPLALREQVIGQISLTGDAEWSTEQRNLVETVAAQAALALENARLVEQSQAAALYEHQLAEITGKIWTATTVEGILQTAIKELGQALDATDARVELKLEADDE